MKCLKCNTEPHFNYQGDKKRLYCSKHKLDGMVNVGRDSCLNCGKTPNYNYQGETSGLYCSTHKLQNMVDVKNKKCLNCNRQPNFNYKGDKTALYCSKHKLDKMVNVTLTTCLKCEKTPSYNYQGEKRRLYCEDHKFDGMVDVHHKTCLTCDKRPSFNYKGLKPAIYCTTHKLENMVNVVSKMCLDCDTVSIYHYVGHKQGLYCKEHKLEGMVNVVDKRCKSDWCDTIPYNNNKYEGYCFYCYINLFPNKPVTRNYKTKERSVVEFVLQHFPQDKFTWITDKIVPNGCSRRRPDMMLDLGYQVIVIEVDENQHQSYDCSCNNKRLMELSQDVGHRPLIFIRFNPDNYLDITNKNITSCWSLNKLGLCTIKKTKQKEWYERLSILKEHIDYWCNPINVTEKTVEVIQLFFNY